MKKESKKGSSKKKAVEEEKERNKLDEEYAAKRKVEEEERQHAWEQLWERTLKADELRKGYHCTTPKTQMNVWVNSSKDKWGQEMMLTFRRAPITKPKAPPIPTLWGRKRYDLAPPVAPKSQEGEKKKKKKGKL